jgi:hypothetical protein
MELLTFNTDISSFYPHMLRKIHAQFNTIIKIIVKPYKQN